MCQLHSNTSARGRASAGDCDCNPGYYLNASSEECIPCEPDRIKRTSGPQQCDICPDNTYAANAVNSTTGQYVLDLTLDILPVCTCPSGKQPVLTAEGTWVIEDGMGTCEGCTDYTYYVSSIDTRLAMCQHCENGTYVIDSETPCEECPSVTISFSVADSLSDCTACADSDGVRIAGLVCVGGSRFYIMQGYYLSPNARYCNDADDPEDCFLHRIYHCHTEDACTTTGLCDGASDCRAEDYTDELSAYGWSKAELEDLDEEDVDLQRQGNSTADVVQLQLCNEQAYAKTVLCGGSEVPACSKSHHLSADRTSCGRCPSKPVTFVLLSLVILTMAGLMGVIFYFFAALSSDLEPQHVVVTAEQERKNQLLTVAKGASTLLVGYLQVISQLSFVYSQDVLPSSVGTYTTSVNWVNINLGAMLNVQCVTYYTFPDSEHTAILGFLADLWSAVLMPWMLMYIIFIVYLGLLTARKPSPNAVDELLWRRDTRSSCVAVWLYLMMLVHPGISTTLFQLFSCEHIEYEDSEVDSHSDTWLKMDARIMCFETRRWTAAAAAAIVTMVFYSFGAPVALLAVMRKFRRHVKVCFRVSDLWQHAALITHGHWKATDLSDKVLVADMESAEKRGDAGYQEHFSRFVELYIDRATFREVVQLEPAEGSDGAQEQEARLVNVAHRRRAAALGTFSDLEGSNDDFKRWLMRRTKILVNGSETPIEVVMYHKDDGSGQCGPRVTFLDAHNNVKVFGQFCIYFHDRIYFWQTWEISRRVLQTGVVVGVNLVTNTDAVGVIYGILVAWVAGMLHVWAAPYKIDAMQRLQFVILTNQFAVQVLVALIAIEEDGEDTIKGIIITIILLQMLVISYGLRWMVPAIRPLSELLFSKGKKKISRLRTHKIVTKIASSHGNIAFSTENNVVRCRAFTQEELDSDDVEMAINPLTSCGSKAMAFSPSASVEASTSISSTILDFMPLCDEDVQERRVEHNQSLYPLPLPSPTRLSTDSASNSASASDPAPYTSQKKVDPAEFWS
ncbi:hypothetical protein CYMTET_42863 [Cymbomonas tetramitiformis]|uniref:Tyrosine-protein kinase ephrin type A/B receptor-like domain-containing protein n=1 Tax=Cymbomonas tetramitiformis TaxID=36881 RepID=A0AAE0F0U7_9CHLO|nr:hypothetical protein CYMTET_42863 [Cymbomonas tetramitiformis]